MKLTHSQKRWAIGGGVGVVGLGVGYAIWHHYHHAAESADGAAQPPPGVVVFPPRGGTHAQHPRHRGHGGGAGGARQAMIEAPGALLPEPNTRGEYGHRHHHHHHHHHEDRARGEY